MRVLEKLKVKNFKSIRDQTLRLGHLNVFIGGNGAGKSNLVGVFHFLNRVVSGDLQNYTGETGGADIILHFGRKQSPSLAMELEFAQGQNANGYSFELRPTAEDRFIFSSESFWFHDRSRYSNPLSTPLGSGHSEAHIQKSTERIAGWVKSDLDSYRIYHFHDTSSSAKVKQTGDVDDNRRLHTDAGNLAAFLYRLQQKYAGHFQNIEDTIRQIAPFFEGFRLEPSRLNPDKIRLEWREKGSETYFNAHALSDGTLRFMCLATLLLQPTMPAVILLDEPELGLHPAAISLLADLLVSASQRTQVLVATQSVTLVNQFTPESVWVVERDERHSVFKHLESADMSAWLEDYSLGELWEKNIIGGRP
ncbi:MAG: chromosome segregation protein SMC [Verrucomicrobia bacterium]|nr:MAG: chromosome segregation protein SMC [Verrucomicrobiota bacterium]